LIVLEDIAATAAATAADLLWIRSALAAEIAEKPINNPELHRDKEFIESGGVKCPRCKSTEVATGPVDFGDDGRRAFCMIECLSCEEKVYQVFELVGWSRNNEWLK
jgi:hypothetical protein